MVKPKRNVLNSREVINLLTNDQAITCHMFYYLGSFWSLVIHAFGHCWDTSLAQAAECSAYSRGLEGGGKKSIGDLGPMTLGKPIETFVGFLLNLEC